MTIGVLLVILQAATETTAFTRTIDLFLTAAPLAREPILNLTKPNSSTINKFFHWIKSMLKTTTRKSKQR